MSAGVPSPGHFEALFRTDADPWRTRTRWYERRKRCLTLAALPQERYHRAFEPGCAVGELTAALAERCDEIVASDASPLAVAHARKRLGAVSGARVEVGSVPQHWPGGRFDLIVVSELGYYLSTAALDLVAVACKASLTADGTLLACHWKRGAADMLQSAHDVHAALDAGLALCRVACYEDDDLRIDVWSGDPRSVAQRERLA